MPRKDRRIGGRRFIRNNLYRVEQITKARLRQFAFLIQQIALRYQHHPVVYRHCRHRRARMRQQINRMRQHLAACCHDLGNHRRRNPPLGHFDRRFDHRQRKAFHAKPVMPQIAPLGREEPVMQVVSIRKFGQKRREPALRQPKERLVLPQRIISIKGNGGYHRSVLQGLRALGKTSPLFSLAICAILRHLQHSLPLCQRLFHVSMRPLTLSDTPDGPGNGPGNDTSILTKPKTKSQRPPLYKVMLLNDDYTPMEFVVHVLERFFGLTHAQSFDIMLTVHKKGLAVVGVFSHEIAETKVAQVMDFARRHQHPLQCTMEKE